MSFLLDTNICSAHITRPSGLAHRFIQHLGRLNISTIVLGELYVWAYQRPNPEKLLRAIENELLQDIVTIKFDESCALTFGKVRGSLLRNGISVSALDMQIASVALTHDLTLVTHNTSHFVRIPCLRLEDWLVQ
ncbi:MAG TPA: type II toxin-antitoxin system VapC family toxin [Pirellulaceae bacterium]|jgi:tRNA(fMet)-specific endonuclease VapC